MKKAWSIVLALCLAFSLAAPALAEAPVALEPAALTENSAVATAEEDAAAAKDAPETPAAPALPDGIGQLPAAPLQPDEQVLARGNFRTDGSRFVFAEGQKAVSGQYATYYEQLGTVSRMLYDALLAEAQRVVAQNAVGQQGQWICGEIVVPEEQTEDAFFNLYEYMHSATDAFVFDHPEFFFLQTTWQFSWVPGETLEMRSYVYLYPDYRDNQALYEQHNARIQANIQEVVNAAASKPTRAEKLAVLNDWLAANNQYSTQTPSGDIDAENQLMFSAASALLGENNPATGPVCQGYAFALKVLCDRVGIPCMAVSGTAGGAGHMRCYVQMDDGAFYACDPTWNDPVGGDPNHNYLLLTRAQNEADFTEDVLWAAYPQLSETPYNMDTPPAADREQVTAFVTRLYETCLGRAPDAAGLATWVDGLAGRTYNGTQAAQGFVFSAEFKNRSYCNEDYVKQLYRAFLGREADASGLATWVSMLEDGATREEVFNGFAGSKEFGDLCTSYGIAQGGGIPVPAPGMGTIPGGPCSVCGKAAPVTEFLTRLYETCMGRAPDASGMATWTQALVDHTHTGREVAWGFVFSKEFTGAGYSDEEFMEQLYRAFMGREADASGLATWVSLLEDGGSRQDVFDGFVGSREFSDLCAQYGIARG